MTRTKVLLVGGFLLASGCLVVSLFSNTEEVRREARSVQRRYQEANSMKHDPSTPSAWRSRAPSRVPHVPEPETRQDRMAEWSSRFEQHMGECLSGYSDKLAVKRLDLAVSFDKVEGKDPNVLAGTVVYPRGILNTVDKEVLDASQVCANAYLAIEANGKVRIPWNDAILFNLGYGEEKGN